MQLLIQDFFKRILTVYTRIEKIFMFAHIYTIKDDNIWFEFTMEFNIYQNCYFQLSISFK